MAWNIFWISSSADRCLTTDYRIATCSMGVVPNVVQRSPTGEELANVSHWLTLFEVIDYAAASITATALLELKKRRNPRLFCHLLFFTMHVGFFRLHPHWQSLNVFSQTAHLALSRCLWTDFSQGEELLFPSQVKTQGMTPGVGPRTQKENKLSNHQSVVPDVRCAVISKILTALIFTV